MKQLQYSIILLAMMKLNNSDVAFFNEVKTECFSGQRKSKRGSRSLRKEHSINDINDTVIIRISAACKTEIRYKRRPRIKAAL